MPTRTRTRNHSRSVGRSIASVAAVLTLGTACSPSDGPAATFDLDLLEQDVVAALEPAYDADGLTLFGVSCPDGTFEAGDIFACTADVERQFVRIRVEASNGPSSFDWTTLDIVHRLDVTEAAVGAEISEALGDEIRISCGSPRIRVLPIGASFRCDAIDSAGNLAPALLTVNGSGQTGWEILG